MLFYKFSGYFDTHSINIDVKCIRYLVTGSVQNEIVLVL